MVRWYYNQRIGEVYTKQKDGKVYKVNIFGGNCLCVFTYQYTDEKTGKRMEQFLNFYADEQHIKNIIKEYNHLEPVDGITSIRLNTYYKEAMVLLKYFTKCGYKVKCYYKEPKEK